MPELAIWEVFEKMWSIVIELSIANCSHIYRVSKKKLTAFIFKLAFNNLLLGFDNSHVYSQQDVGN